MNCLSRGDDDIDEQLGLGKAEVLDFPDHVGRLVFVVNFGGRPGDIMVSMYIVYNLCCGLNLFLV